MDNHRRLVDFFFLDDIDANKDYVSISVGDVWLYFYKEILIGVRDMRRSVVVFLAVGDDHLKSDGYSHRHEITFKTIERLASGDLKEVYPQANPPAYLREDDLASLAFEWVAQSVSQLIDKQLNVVRR